MSHLLVIDDDRNTLLGLVELLQDEGYTVSSALNGHEALKYTTSKSIDIVLCDYSLPDMNGLEVCYQLMKHQPKIIIFLITAFYDRKLFASAKSYGITEIITKPIIWDDILKKLSIYSKKSTEC